MEIKLKSAKGLEITLPEPTSPPTISKTIEYEKEKEEGTTEYVQEYKGYNIPQITLNYEFATDDWEDAEENLKTLIKVYEHIEDGKPAVWSITEHFINLNGIKKVVCKDLQTQKFSQDTIKAVIKFEEYKPKVIKKEKKTQNQEKTKDKKASSKEVKNPCKKHGFTDAKCRQYYYRYRAEKEKGLTSAPFEVWLAETIKKEGKPISAED